MPKTHQQKENEIKNFKNELIGLKGAVFADYTGLKVDAMQKLRSDLKDAGAKLTAARKTLLKIAFADSVLKDINFTSLPGAVSIATSQIDEVAPAKIMVKFAKENDALKIQGGILENKFIDLAKVQELSNLPSKIELLAKVVGSIQSPVSGFVNVLAGNLRSFVYVLNAVKEKKS